MTNTLATKVMEGLSSQGWEVIGRGGTWSEAMRPLDAYVQRKVERAVKAEREACARLCDEYAKNSSNPMNFAENCAAAIRAKGET